MSHLKNDRPRVLYRAGDGADQTLEKESRAVRASPAFSQICAALEIDRRPISDPGGPAGHPLPSIRLKIIDRASHVPRGRIEDQETLDESWTRKRRKNLDLADYWSDV